MGPVGYCGLILAFVFSCTGETQKTQQIPSPHQDCTQIKAESPQSSSGAYTMFPAGVKSPFRVYCEMRADGGWTVLQMRTGPELSFSRSWADYKNGFGDVTKDHWLGLQNMFSLTKDKTKKWVLRVDLWDYEGGTAFAEYQDFKLGSEEENFKLHVGKYSGTAGDAIRGAHPGIDQNGCGFSTLDRDNDNCSPCIFGDISVRECVTSFGGGWWYSSCGSAGLNGDWHPAGDNIGWASGVHWRTWKGPAPYSAKASRMMIKSV
ncbi:angiopoietin-4-like [Echeneis naucrates]|uniref:angiopoietin-4-like n=1 Tax=Echeneis naucrates TaxID=173247 RepID=UPI0011135BB5|nr:angiopoietin-4-like [Echeneis naucrates]